MMTNCMICPRECGVDRTGTGRGACRAPAEVILARAALHFWEEPCISGKAGSGAVFFSGCSLGCIYCQNAAISFPQAEDDTRQRTGGGQDGMKQNADAGQDGKRQGASAGTGCERPSIYRGLPGIKVKTEEMAEIFLRLQDESLANNINLVTATHYIPQAAEALSIAKKHGLKIPVIYNSGGYEKTASLKMLEGLVDVYLPDFKYITPDTAREYSHAPDYPQIAKAAIAEMVRQTKEASFYTGRDHTMLIQRGVIVRHLLLPGHVSEAKKIVSYLHTTYGNSIYLSLMNQYTPMPRIKAHPPLDRKTTRREYERLIDHAIGIGVENGFIQEGDTAKESFIPEWNGEGVRAGAQRGRGAETKAGTAGPRERACSYTGGAEKNSCESNCVEGT